MLKDKINKSYFKKPEFILSIILFVNFLIRIIIYYNTTLFYFSDFSAYLNAIDEINKMGAIPLIRGNFLYFNSYIGYFFKYILGDLDYYFIFNCLIGTLTSLVIFYICNKLTKNKWTGVLSAALHLIYIEFIAWSSIFYTPIIMMFLLSLILLLLINYINYNNYKKYLYGILIVLLINFTFYFKGEMRYIWILFVIFGIIFYKKREILLKFTIIGILLFLSTQILQNQHILPYNEGNIKANDFVFFGHTMYGGDGGDGAFIYEENEARYTKNLDKYLKKNNIPDSLRNDRKIRNRFQIAEVKKFITQHPFKWVYLQFYKFTRFFGVIPEGRSYDILSSGIFNGNIILTAALLVIPLSVILLLSILAFKPIILNRIIKRPELLLITLIFLYYIAGSVFYGQYQERYRMPLMVCFIIPYLSWSILNFEWKKIFRNKIELYIKSAIMFIVIVIWLFQTYDAMVVHRDRYLESTYKASENFLNNC